MLKRETWDTRIGFILAAVGSAVGLGNIWRFPFRAGQAGGAAFVIIYLAFVFLIGLPSLLVEFVIGRRAKKDVVDAFDEIGYGKWKFVGIIGAVTGFIITAYYSVVSGWVLRYIGASATGSYFADVSGYFETISTGTGALLFHLVFMGIIAGIDSLGVKKGIEKTVKFMVPAIAFLFGILGIYAFTLEGSGAGYSFYLSPDFAYIAENWFSILSEAAGQAFFTLSLGMGALVTYASYLHGEKNMFEDAASIVGFDTLIAVIGGFVVFPLLFAAGIRPAEPGAGALFIGVSEAIAQIPGGRAIGFMLFFAVFIAALSSAVSILEVIVSYAVDHLGIRRKVASPLVATLIFLAGVPVALRGSLLGVYDHFASKVLLPLGMFLLVLFVGWFFKESGDELSKGIESKKWVKVWLWYVRIPILLVTAFVLVINVLDYLGVLVL
ncbi:MAG: sodium-dependent transporter [Candidatus Aenigmatarchaeota archaeon]